MANNMDVDETNTQISEGLEALRLRNDELEKEVDSRHKEQSEKLMLMTKVFMESIDPIIILDMEGRIVNLNKAAENIYEWELDEILGEDFKIIIPKECHEQVSELITFGASLTKRRGSPKL